MGLGSRKQRRKDISKKREDSNKGGKVEGKVKKIQAPCKWLNFHLVQRNNFSGTNSCDIQKTPYAKY